MHKEVKFVYPLQYKYNTQQRYSVIGENKMTQLETDWSNYGDVNFTEYGGLLIRQDPDYMDSTYNVIQVYTPFDNDEIPFRKVWGWLFSVDLEDNWIDWNKVCACDGLNLASASKKDRVAAAVSYYGNQEFNPIPLGDNSQECTMLELIATLEEIGAGEFIPESYK